MLRLKMQVDRDNLAFARFTKNIIFGEDSVYRDAESKGDET